MTLTVRCAIIVAQTNNKVNDYMMTSTFPPWYTVSFSCHRRLRMTSSKLPYSYVGLKPRLHDTTCCQAGCQTGWFDNRVNVCIHDTTGCQTSCQAGCQIGLTNGLYRVYSRLSNRLYNPVWQPVERTVLFVQHGCQTGCQTRLTPVYNRFDNRLYRVNGV